MNLYKKKSIRNFISSLLPRYIKNKMSALIFNYKKPNIVKEDYNFLKDFFYKDMCLIEKKFAPSVHCSLI